MRIIGTIDHPTMKITCFQHDGKLSAKFESGLMEQTYKFREMDGLNNMEGLERLLDATFLGGVLQNFRAMHQARQSAMRAYLQQLEGDDFPEII